MNDGQECLGHLHVALFRDGSMAITAYAQLRVTAPVVGDDGSTGLNGSLDEATQRLGTSVWHHRKSNTSGVPACPPLVEAAPRLALFNLDGSGDKYHVVNASTLAASAAADVGFIGFDMLSGVTANPILVGAHHAGPQFVKNLEGGLISRQPELPLELDGRHAGRLAGNQVGCAEPHGERCVGTFHERARSDARIAVAMTAPTNAEAIGEAIRLSGCASVATN